LNNIFLKTFFNHYYNSWNTQHFFSNMRVGHFSNLTSTSRNKPVFCKGPDCSFLIHFELLHTKKWLLPKFEPQRKKALNLAKLWPFLSRSKLIFGHSVLGIRTILKKILNFWKKKEIVFKTRLNWKQRHDLKKD
jgi:hypothetical protein